MAVTLDGERGYIPKMFLKRCCFQQPGWPWQRGAYGKSPDNAGNRFGGIHLQLHASTVVSPIVWKGAYPCCMRSSHSFRFRN